MQRLCANQWCKQTFEITEEDQSFLENLRPTISGNPVELPIPTQCPYCRMVRRCITRNVWNLYRRECDLCKKTIVSSFAPDKPHTVYCQQCWWGDGWDELNYGREYDFKKPFFDQYEELQKVVPRISLMNKAPENSEYCNYAGFNKDCYLAVGGSWHNEGCLYGMYYGYCIQCLESFGLRKCELCHEAAWGSNLYLCTKVYDSFESSDCHLSTNLRGCKNCILCSNLRNKEFYIRNKPASKEEFAALKKTMRSWGGLQSLLKEFDQLYRSCVHPNLLNVNVENSSGDYLRNCKNVSNGYWATNIEDGRHIFWMEDGKNFMDCVAVGYDGSECFYECANSGNAGMNNYFSFNNWTCDDVFYCDTPQLSSNCFGCISVRHKRYCILNKQYSREDYEALVPKIIEHMRATREWGEFFPMKLCPFAYNEGNSAMLEPISKDEALSRGLTWCDRKEERPGVEKIIPAQKLPDAIDEIPDDIVNWAIECELTGRPFRIIKQELDLLRKIGLPVPHFHPDERHQRRMARRNPIKLRDAKCTNCGKEMKTTYPPRAVEKIWCEECYLKEVY